MTNAAQEGVKVLPEALRVARSDSLSLLLRKAGDALTPLNDQLSSCLGMHFGNANGDAISECVSVRT